jgi:hypothetical protein
MPEANEQYFKRGAGIAWLWAGVLAGPIALALNQSVIYLLVTLTCSYGRPTVLIPAILLMLALAAGGAFISWRNWQQAGSSTSDNGGDAMSRSRFMGIVGILLSALSALGIIAMWLPTFFYRQCQR